MSEQETLGAESKTAGRASGQQAKDEAAPGEAGAQPGAQTEPAEAGAALDAAARADLERQLRSFDVDPAALAEAAERRAEPAQFVLGLIKAFGALREEDLRELLSVEGWAAAQGLFESGRLAKHTYPDAGQPRSRWVQPLGMENLSSTRREQISAALEPGRVYLELLSRAEAAPARPARGPGRARWPLAALVGLGVLGLVLGYLAFTQSNSNSGVAPPAPTPSTASSVGLPAATDEPTATPAPTLEPTPLGATPTLVPGEECGRAVVAGTRGDPLSLRANPTTTAGLIKRLPEGTELTLLCDAPQKAEGRTWYRVQTRAGERGWVSGTFLEPRP